MGRQEENVAAGARPVSLVGAYELHAPIAAGGMATVHLARARSGSHDIVAIKRLRAHLAEEQDFVTMFLDEARLTAQIKHENVVETFEVITSGGELFLVMEYVVGESLSKLTRAYAPPSFNIASRVLADTLHGLHAAHEAVGPDGKKLHIIHRDVSPQNILVTVDGIAKLIDFGVAKAVGRMQHTRDGELKGKIAYMPPEQLMGRTCTPQSDVYSMGVVLWEFLTGKRLFHATNEGEIVTKIIRGEVPRVRDVWAKQAQRTLSLLAARDLEKLDAITMRALALDPTARFSTAREMALALEEALEPAPRAEVAAWVKSAARELLASRAALVAEIASAVVPKATRTRSVLAAHLAGPAPRDFLFRVAASGGTVQVPLLEGPADESEHILEIHIPNESAPKRLSARPAGPRGPNGFPLTLGPYVEAVDPPTTMQFDPPTVQGDPSTHTSEDLESRVMVEANVLGRIIAKGTLELEARIGGGGSGAVFRARHRELRSKVVAVKVLHESTRRDREFSERFHAEALAASRLDHVNLVRVLDFGQEPDGLLYLSMEFLDGLTVRQLIERERRLPKARALSIMLQICAGLAHAHAAGIIHRDIKPSNVVLVSKRDDDGEPIEVVKVCDFGIALQRAASDAPAPRIAGTPEYMSPEQYRGADVDARSDVYSCGVMLYELTTGRLPGMQSTPPSKVVPDIDPLLELVILRATARDPADRFASALDLRAALAALRA